MAQFGTVRQQPGTKIVAVRSAYPADSPMAWLVANPNLAPSGGGYWASEAEIDTASWDNLTPIIE